MAFYAASNSKPGDFVSTDASSISVSTTKIDSSISGAVIIEDLEFLDLYKSLVDLE